MWARCMDVRKNRYFSQLNDTLSVTIVAIVFCCVFFIFFSNKNNSCLWKLTVVVVNISTGDL